jgi:hypothetical protein
MLAMAVITPERSLAVRCPQVAALWHPDRNERWTPGTVSVAGDLEVWWACPAGHEWIERVRDRVAPRRWKQNDIAACGVCVGYHTLQSCPCGQDNRVARAPTPATAHKCRSCTYECWKARVDARWREQRLREAARTDYVPDRAEADALLDDILPAGLPPVLVVEWRRAYRPHVLFGMVNERGYGNLGIVGAIDSALVRIKELSSHSLPVPERLSAAHAAGQPADILGRRYWTRGVLHVLQLPAARPPRDQSSPVSLERAVRAGLRQVIARDKPAGEYATAALTRILTDLVMQWGASDDTGPWSSFFELVPPFIPSTGSVCGNLDVVLTRPGSRDMVVEIDSTNKDRSMEKLRFAHRAGATAVWIRWRQGLVRKVPGVHVIDLVSDTRKTRRRTSVSS